MQIRCIDRRDELLPHRADWNRLAQQSPTNTIFQTCEWLASWWEAFDEESQPRVVLGFDDGALVAAAPLMAQRRRRYGRTFTSLEFAGGMPSDYSDFLYKNEQYGARLIAALHAELPWEVLRFDRIPSASPTVALLAREFPGWRGTQFVCDVCPSYVFGPGQDGSEILKKKSLRRHENGLKRAGAVEVRHYTQAEEIEPFLDEFFAQHIDRRATTDTPSHFLDPRYQEFYRLLTRRLAAQEWALFTVIFLNEQPVAFHYGFVYGQRLLWYKPTFSTAHARLSPGETLLAALFRFCRERNLRELDFTIGDEAFKERFANMKRTSLRFEAFRSRPLQRFAHAERLVWENAKRFEIVQRWREGWG